MKKINKIIIGVVAIVLVASIAILAGSSGLLKGRLISLKGPVSQLDYSRLFLYKGKIVSVVTSPVTSPVSSVVISDVTSPAGVSRVASVVTSPVASAVASAVAVDKKTASKIDTKKLKNLTESILRLIEKEDYKKNPEKFTSAAKEDYLKNPSKFTLSEEEKKRIIKLYKYKQRDPFSSQFNF